MGFGRVGCACWVVVLAVCLSTASAQTVGRVTVRVGEKSIERAVVSVEPPEWLSADAAHVLRRRERPDDAGLPIQRHAGRLWFTLPMRLEPGEAAVFDLVRGIPIDPEKGVRVDRGDRHVAVSYRGAPFFRYNHVAVPVPDDAVPHDKKFKKESFRRSAYIHPLMSPNGTRLTEDFPADHLHHKGIWMPWVHTKFEGHEVDFWNLGKETGTVRFAGFERTAGGPVFGQLRVKHEHVDKTQNKVVLNEVWDVRAYAMGGPGEKGFWVFDVTSTQRCASDSPLELLKYRYGGMGFRGPETWKQDAYKVLTSEGRTKADGHATRGRWCAHAGPAQGGRATVVLMSHPSNHEHPEPMRIWPKGGAFFNWAPVQAGDWTLKPGEPYVFRYRFLVHEGAIDAEAAERAWQAFARPPKVVFEKAGD